MFIGHYGLAFAAKKIAPRASLGVLFLATQWIDLLWPIFLLLGWEHVRIDPGNTAMTPLDFYDYPISHSLLAVFGWSAVVGLFYFAVRRFRREALVVGLLVLSHWFLDVLMHRPDLPLYPGSTTKAGLSLWDSPAVTIGLEFLIFASGVLFYLRAASPLKGKARISLWFLAGLLTAIWLGNLFGPPPPNTTAIAWSGLGLWLFVWWAYSIDRKKETRNPP